MYLQKLPCLTLFALAIFISNVSAQDPQETVNLVIGTYSKGANTPSKSEGVYTTQLDLSTGALSKAKLMFKSKDPTYLAISSKNIIYSAVREGNGIVSAMSVDDKQQLNFINQQETHGKDPCYLSLSPNEKYIAVANYNGSNVSIFALSPSGEILPNPTVINHNGSSVNVRRKTSPHPHWVQWSPHDEEVIYVVDLGTDKVMKYTFDSSTGNVTKTSVAFASKPGSGPRHLAFHPAKKLAYIVNELTSTVDLVKIEDNGSFTFIDQKSTLPKDYNLGNSSAHIAINKTGDYLYTSNRGLNSIAVFSLDSQGKMTLKENIDTGGHWPRFFTLLEQHGYLLVANKKSNNIVVFKIKSDGSLVKTSHHLLVEQPTFIDKY